MKTYSSTLYVPPKKRDFRARAQRFLSSAEDQACISFLLDCLIDHVKEYGRQFRHARRLFSGYCALSFSLLSSLLVMPMRNFAARTVTSKRKSCFGISRFLWTNGAEYHYKLYAVVQRDRFLLRRIAKLLIGGWVRKAISSIETQSAQEKKSFQRGITWECWSRVITEKRKMMNVSLQLARRLVTNYTTCFNRWTMWLNATASVKSAF